MAFKLDIFETLEAIDRRNFEFLDKKPDDQRKAFAPLVVQRWASAVNNGQQSDLTLMLVNEYSNLNMFDIGDHPELQYKLLAACGLGSKQRHHWIAMPKSGGKKQTKLTEFLLEYWPEANEMELNILLRRFTRESFEDFVNGCGLTPKQIEETMNAYDSYYGITGKKARGKKKGG